MAVSIDSYFNDSYLGKSLFPAGLYLARFDFIPLFLTVYNFLGFPILTVLDVFPPAAVICVLDVLNIVSEASHPTLAGYEYLGEYLGVCPLCRSVIYYSKFYFYSTK